MNPQFSEFELVKKCLAEIEDKLSWGNSRDWHNEVFVELSEQIQKSTHIMLSPTTLKRIWGKVNYQGKPSISTLNALSKFAGYTNWREFKTKRDTTKKEIRRPSFFLRKSTAIPSLIIGLVIVVVLFSMIGITWGSKKNHDFSTLVFTSQPVTEGLPNSVVFDFDIANIDSDNIYIQQFWDPRRTIKIDKSQQQATGIYYFPGHFKSKLLVDSEIVQEHNLFIKSPTWMGTIDYEPVPKYIGTQDIHQSDKLALPSEIIAEIASMPEPLVSTYHLVDDFGTFSGDNFHLEATLRNSYQDKWAVCQTTKIVVLGTKGALIIPFSIAGCVSDLGLMLNDVYYNGKQHDLSALAVDLSSEKKIELKVVDKKVQVLIAETMVLERSYHETMGDIVGLRIRFLGAGEVLNLNVEDDMHHSRINLNKTMAFAK